LVALLAAAGSPTRSGTPFPAGRPSVISWTTAVSSSTTIPSSARSGPSRWADADDTPIPVLDPGRGRTKTGRLWVYTRDDRPWGGPDPPAAVYFYSADRKAERPASHLKAFHGVLQVDGYAGFERLTARGEIVLAACWAHTRRKFFDVHEATGSPIAAEALRRIAELYAIETSIRGRTAVERRRFCPIQTHERQGDIKAN
jgi:hypothetical protein